MANDNVDNFQVRTITESSTVLKKFFIDLLEEEGWFPGRDDIDIFLACDPNSLYVGELNGKPVAAGALFKYNEEYGHFGCYVTNKDHRGGDYGFKLAAESWRRCQPIENLGGFSVLDMIEKYGKSMDAVAHWPMERHIVDIPTALSFLKDAISSNASPPFSIKQVSDVDLKALFDYDTKVFGYKREKFVDRLLQVSHARVAVGQQHEIVGYAAARVLYNPDNGYRVGPVFGESIEIAKCLLVEVF
ncbi:uncharacterized protein LOC114516124 [Dendronephthya gigantea]|uniref:uncharacterized protein LOC114516124 n=1 Tax=Dendronephthya gigantea TaxID=151771 RepID=UPI00106BDE4B|nr:uncharacterized protein LOC114516124 [Dendronephthya gigantea]